MMETTFHLLLYRAFHMQRSYLRPCLREIGLGSGQPKLLSYIAAHPDCRPKELADYFEIDPAAVSRMLDTMEKSGIDGSTSSPASFWTLALSAAFPERSLEE